MKRALSICLYMILFLFVPHKAHAAENVKTEKKAVVFILDASGSMKTNDPKRYAIDSISCLDCISLQAELNIINLTEGQNKK